MIRVLILAWLALHCETVVIAQTKAIKSGLRTDETKPNTSGATTAPVGQNAGKKKSPKNPTRTKTKNQMPNHGLHQPAVDKPQNHETAKNADPIPNSQFSIALNFGYESAFGNGLTATYWSSPNFALGVGAGYSYSGLRGGIFSLVGIETLDQLYLVGGGAIGISAGRSDEISFDAKFKPEGSNNEEPITASRRFELSSAQLVSLLTGIRWCFSESVSASLLANYNFVVGGNHIRFTEEIQFNQVIIPSNLDSFNQEFDRRAHDLLLAGGLGAAIGIAINF